MVDKLHLNIKDKLRETSDDMGVLCNPATGWVYWVFFKFPYNL